MNEEIYIRFEKYLTNEMTSEEKIAFEEQLKSDQSFKENFELYKETTHFLEHKFSKESAAFKTNLKSISNQHFNIQKEVKVISFKPWYYAVAASVVVFLGTWFMMQNNVDYSEFYEHENANFTERGSIIQNLRLAQDAFNKKNYKTAAENFEIVLKSYDKPEVRFFYGISLLEANKVDEAINTFSNLQKGTSIYKDKAIWYLALSYLKLNKIKECKNYINQIPEDAEDYEKAQKLLNKIE